MNWQEQFEIIKKIIAEELARHGQKFTLANAADLLDVKVPKLQAWGRGQRPTADDLGNICRKLNLRSEWVLLGNGFPRDEEESGRFLPEFVEIGDTLHEWALSREEGLSEVAKAGGISLDDLSRCMGSHTLPSCLTIARWVHAYRLNANFLIAQVGQPYLTEDEYTKPGPLSKLREKRGDFDEPEEAESQNPAPPATEPKPAEKTQIDRELQDVEDRMLKWGASPEEVKRAIMAHLGVHAPTPWPVMAHTLLNEIASVLRYRNRRPGSGPKPAIRTIQ